MTTLYCPECGYKNEYSIHPPKFCGGCGESLSVNSGKVAKPKLRSSTPRIKQEALAEDETDSEFIPNLSKLDIDIDYNSASAKIFKNINDIPNAS